MQRIHPTRFEADAPSMGMLTDSTRFGPVLDVVVFKSGQLFVIEVHVLSRARDHLVP